MQTERTGFFLYDCRRRRGQTLLEVVIAIGVLTIIFLFIAESLVASSRTLNLSTANTTQIAAANYYLGLMKSDSGFWLDQQTGFSTGGAVDLCGNQLTPYDDVYPSPPASPDWHPAPACSADPVQQTDPNHSISRVDYLWSASPNPNNGYAEDLTLWLRTHDSTGDHVYETHSIRYENPMAASPAVPSPPHTQPPGSPPVPTPTPLPTPTPSPTPIGI